MEAQCGLWGEMESKNVVGILVPHLSWSSDFPVFLWQVHTHPMTTPTRSMARIAHSPPSPPPSVAMLGQDSILRPSAVTGPSIMVFDVVVPDEARFVVDELSGGPVVGGDGHELLQSASVGSVSLGSGGGPIDVGDASGGVRLSHCAHVGCVAGQVWFSIGHVDLCLQHSTPAWLEHESAIVQSLSVSSFPLHVNCDTPCMSVLLPKHELLHSFAANPIWHE